MESIGLYHQTSDCTSRFLPTKSISRLDWHDSAAGLGFPGTSSWGAVDGVAPFALRSQAVFPKRLGFSRRDVGSDHLQVLAGRLEGLFGVMLGYKTGIVVESRVPFPPETVEYRDQAGIF